MYCKNEIVLKESSCVTGEREAQTGYHNEMKSTASVILRWSSLLVHFYDSNKIVIKNKNEEQYHPKCAGSAAIIGQAMKGTYFSAESM